MCGDAVAAYDPRGLCAVPHCLGSERGMVGGLTWLQKPSACDDAFQEPTSPLGH
jgi:hypothetical protein